MNEWMNEWIGKNRKEVFYIYMVSTSDNGLDLTVIRNFYNVKASVSRTTTSGTTASPKPGNSPKVIKWMVDRIGADTSVVKKKHEWNSMAIKKSEWKNTEIWKAKGKAMDTKTGESPGYQSQS